MNNTNFTIEQFRQDVRDVVDSPGMSINRLATDAGVEWAVVKRFLSAKQRTGINASTLERLWPFIYGEKRPLPEDSSHKAA